MLKLPRNWRDRECGLLACRLHEAANGHATYCANFLLAVLAFRENPQSPSADTVKRLDDLAWSVGRVAYVYVPSVDDEAIADCSGFIESHSSVVYISSPGQTRSLQSVLFMALKRRYPLVMSFGEFVSMHFAMAVREVEYSYSDHLVKLLEFYNELVSKEYDGARFTIESDELYWAY